MLSDIKREHGLSPSPTSSAPGVDGASCAAEYNARTCQGGAVQAARHAYLPRGVAKRRGVRVQGGGGVQLLNEVVTH
jgi:hypothetical protein